MKVILDTNIFLVPEKFKVDIFEEFDRLIDEKYDLITIEPVVKELKKLSMGNSRDARAARFGLKFLEAKSIKVTKTKEDTADKAIVSLSENFLRKSEECAVATLDKELKRKLKKIGVKVIYLRNKKYLAIGEI